jgi:acetylornithine deacetylase
MMARTSAEILKELVAIPSVSNVSNIPLLDAIAAILEPAGWWIRRFPYKATGGLEKANLLAVPQRFRNTLPDVDLLFVCHTDTVPYQPGWTSATQLREVEGNLHGCGSCDVKGAMAGLLSAARQVDADAIHAPVAYAFTAEEEIGCIGAARLAASGAIRARLVMVCEPTSLRPAIAGKGYGLAQVGVSGHEAHSAFPAKGASAINAAAQFIVALEREQAKGSLSDSLFNPPHTTFNVGAVQGGTAKNIIAGECTFLVEWRPLPSEDPRAGGQLLEALAEQIAPRTGCAIHVDVLRADRGFANAALGLSDSLSRILGRVETGISFGSEATRFAALAEQVVVIGPGDMETAHSERECVPAGELQEWTEAVKHLLLHGIRPENVSVREASV